MFSQREENLLVGGTGKVVHFVVANSFGRRQVGSSEKIPGRAKPHFAKRYRMLVPMTPKPYLHDRVKLIELASGKYLVGQEISPMLNRQ